MVDFFLNFIDIMLVIADVFMFIAMIPFILMDLIMILIMVTSYCYDKRCSKFYIYYNKNITIIDI